LKQRLSILEGVLPGQFNFRLRGDVFVACLAKLNASESVEWVDANIPSALKDKGSTMNGFVLSVGEDCVKQELSRVGALTSASGLRAAMLGENAPEFAESEILLISRGQEIRGVYLSHDTDSIYNFALIPPDSGLRLPPGYAMLSEKTVGLLGCGSIGSKVASMLARAGVHKFLLVDDDVLRPENLVRNELDWEDVGVHKVEAVANRIKVLRADAEIDVRRQCLGGQESSGAFSGVMAALSRCDVIIDASGDDAAFNYAADVAARFARPMVWAKVFGGGFGGMLVRCRPGVEPSPQIARSRIEQWCVERDVVPPPSAQNYEIDGDSGPMVADDADVSVMAGYLARLVIDTLGATDVSVFEHSAYMIGLRKEWIFAAAFDTWPIDIGSPDVKQVDEPLSVADKDVVVANILRLILPTDDHASC
jgi:hypothetical protein